MPRAVCEPLNVLVDAVSARHGGGATFLIEQLRALEKVPDLRLTIITTEASRMAVRDSRPSDVISWPVRSLPVRMLHEQTTIPRLAGDYDVLYVPGNFAIAGVSTPQVLVLQSLWQFGSEARALRAGCPIAMRIRLVAESVTARASVRKAARVICVSETMKSCVAEDLGSADKITVVPPAPPRFPVSVRTNRPSGAYTLSVGIDLPHKDWTGLIKAFERRDDLPPLVLVGRCRRSRRKAVALGSSRSSIRLLGPVIDRGELADLYRNASCVVAHSYLESYGLTAVEALSLGAPLAASDIPAHREFCGGAAHYYDPRDGDALTAAVAEAIHTGPRSTGAPALSRTWAENADATAETLRSAGRREQAQPSLSLR